MLRTKMRALTMVNAMTGRQFIAWVSKLAKARDMVVTFDAAAGKGSHGTLYFGDLKTTVKDRKKEIGKGLVKKMLDDLGIDRSEF